MTAQTLEQQLIEEMPKIFSDRKQIIVKEFWERITRFALLKLDKSELDREVYQAVHALHEQGYLNVESGYYRYLK